MYFLLVDNGYISNLSYTQYMNLTYEQAREFLGEDDEMIEGEMVEVVGPSIDDFDENN